MAEIWQVSNSVEWFLAETGRYEYLGQYENISVSLEMAQKTLDDAVKEPRFEETYRRLQLSIDKKREFYKDRIEPAAKDS
jgi:hypothetical protein